MDGVLETQMAFPAGKVAALPRVSASARTAVSSAETAASKRTHLQDTPSNAAFIGEEATYNSRMGERGGAETVGKKG